MFFSNLKGLRRDSVEWIKVAHYSLVADSCGHDSEYLCDKVSLHATVGVHIRMCPMQLLTSHRDENKRTDFPRTVPSDISIMNQYLVKTVSCIFIRYGSK